MISEELKMMRTEKNLSISDVSKATGISQDTILKFENQEMEPTFDDIYKIAKACNYRIVFRKGDIEITADNVNQFDV